MQTAKSLVRLVMLFMLAVSGMAINFHWDCVLDAAKFGVPLGVCLAANLEDGGIACIGTIPQAVSFLQGCCHSFENGTRNFEVEFEKACAKFGLNHPLKVWGFAFNRNLGIDVLRHSSHQFFSCLLSEIKWVLDGTVKLTLLYVFLQRGEISTWGKVYKSYTSTPTVQFLWSFIIYCQKNDSTNYSYL